jgi:hypothetical protein
MTISTSDHDFSLLEHRAINPRLPGEGRGPDEARELLWMNLDPGLRREDGDEGLLQREANAH